MSRPRWINMNLAGAMFLLAAVIVCVVRVLNISREQGGLGSGKKIVRIVHWQLEPGYREALDHVIDEYNALEHVRAAGVVVRQEAVTEKVYQQFINVHLISGTAPDIIEKGKARLAQGNEAAKYFEPLGKYVSEPNPYNQDAYLPDDLPPALATLLRTAPWRETFRDGMRGGWDERLQNFYGVPTSYVGGARLYYNKDLFTRVRQTIRDAYARQPRADWLARFIDAGYVIDNAALRDWLERSDPPETLGQLLLICRGVERLAEATSHDKLVPIAGSQYSDVFFATGYLTPFTYPYADRLDVQLDSQIDALDTYAGWQRGVWRFEDPSLQGYFDCLRTIARQFPKGFLALDREQANRRFVLGDAAMIATGSWDATSLFLGAEGEVVDPNEPIRPGESVSEIDGVRRKNYRFTVGIMRFPMPGPGEKWSDLTPHGANEALANTAPPFSVYQSSQHKAWAIDFLRFLTSIRINRKFNREAGWVPSVLGATPSPRLAPFLPDPRGVDPKMGMALWGTGQLARAYDGWLNLMLTGEVSYDAFVNKMRSTLTDPRFGVHRIWFEAWEGQLHHHRSQERALAVQAIRRDLLGEPDAPKAHRQVLLGSLQANNATNIRRRWHEQFPEEPFPND